MKNSIKFIAALLLIVGFTFSSCDKDESDVDQDFKVSGYTLNIEGIIATEVIGEIFVCPDGYFGINGKSPDGTSIAISTGKIMVNETRSICSVKLEEEDYLSCIDNSGIYVGGLILNHNYSPLSGTATRTSTNDITISGVLLKDDMSEHAFTLEATASLVSPVNCE